jgi:hypothetical protein
MQLVRVEPPLDLLDRPDGARFFGEVDLDVVLRAGVPGAVLRKGVA